MNWDGDQVVTDGIDRLREGAKVAVIDSGAATRADAAAQDAGARRAALMASLTPQEREQVAKMTQEERRAFFRNRRAQAPRRRLPPRLLARLLRWPPRRRPLRQHRQGLPRALSDSASPPSAFRVAPRRPRCRTRHEPVPHLHPAPHRHLAVDGGAAHRGLAGLPAAAHLGFA